MRRAQLVMLVSLVPLADLDLLDNKDLLALLDHWEEMEKKDLRVLQDHLALKVLLVIQDLLDPLVPWELLVPVVMKESKALLDQLALQETKETRVFQDCLDCVVQEVNPETKETMALLDHKELEAQLVLWALRDSKDLKVFQVQEEILDQREFQANQEMRDHKDAKETKDPQAQSVAQEPKVLKDPWE